MSALLVLKALLDQPDQPELQVQQGPQVLLATLARQDQLAQRD